MWERLTAWLRTNVTRQQAVAIIALCILLAGAFGFGAGFLRVRLPFARPLPPGAPPIAAPFRPPMRGTFGSIDRIEGDVIHVRDARNGRTWSVRAGQNTVIESGPRRPILFNDLHVGQRIFVVGVPNSDTVDARFIGVVYGQPQNFMMPAQPVMCMDCTD